MNKTPQGRQQQRRQWRQVWVCFLCKLLVWQNCSLSLLLCCGKWRIAIPLTRPRMMRGDKRGKKKTRDVKKITWKEALPLLNTDTCYCLGGKRDAQADAAQIETGNYNNGSRGTTNGETVVKEHTHTHPHTFNYVPWGWPLQRADLRLCTV